MKANLTVSLCVAITGISAPMGLSFILKELVGASSLQSFAAGAALSATSLGTTFTILSTTDLITTRLGTVTTSAAMLDDVVGLVMVRIISNFGGDTSSFDAVTVVRPVFVSIGFAVGLYLLCAFGVKPIVKEVLTKKFDIPSFAGTMQFAFLFQTLLLVGMIAGATYAGTSSLFAAYLAGVIVSWLDGLVAESNVPGDSTVPNNPQTGSSTPNQANSPGNHSEQPQNVVSDEAPVNQPSPNDSTPTGEHVFEKYYKQPVNRILIPFFFVSYLPCPQLA